MGVSTPPSQRDLRCEGQPDVQYQDDGNGLYPAQDKDRVHDVRAGTSRVEDHPPLLVGRSKHDQGEGLARDSCRGCLQGCEYQG
jgi:hypothetical protein